MLILEMIIKITGWTQEKLANYLGVSRVTINYWLNGNDISLASKKLICEKFRIPIHYFDVSLDENIEVYKIIHSTLYENIHNLLKQNEQKDDKSKILDILNKIDYDDATIYNRDINEDDIIDALSNGYNPFTGEVFDNNHILNNSEVKSVISKMKNKYYKYGINNIEYDDLSEKQKKIYDRLKKWRMNKTLVEGLYSAYMIFSNRELINIVCAEINHKDDLLNVKGIGKIKYEKYGDELFEILEAAKNE